MRELFTRAHTRAGLWEIFIAAKCRNSEIQTDKDKNVFQFVNTKKRVILTWLLEYCSSNDGQRGMVQISLIPDALVTNLMRVSFRLYVKN